ncbi:MAG: DinB family protein [Frankiaceae bacterium]|nr:DinB family protein [Frankiaceae bacterium]MBV9872521.1 DinB family protein [Frankiaceae bacterium]
MAMNATMTTDEPALLISFLDQQREAVRNAAYGLTDEQAAAAPTASDLSVGGLIKHLASTERGWTSDITGVVATGDRAEQAYLDGFRMTDTDTLADLLADYGAATAATDAAIRAADLDHEVPVPDAPWFPKDVTAWSVRWIVLHLIEETARHAGHADIIRECLDGATSGPLLAAAEGWPADSWITPWAPAVDGASR